MTETLRLIVGLGNPGLQYAQTRHNAGFWFVQALAEQTGIELQTQKKFFGLMGRGSICGNDLRLLMPITFMNRSGQSVQPLMQYYGIEPEQVLIVHDELDLPCGSVKLKSGGGHGGHNGLKDISPRIGSNYARMRIGIDHPGHKSMVAAHVLAKPSATELTAINASIEWGIEQLPTLLSGDWNGAQTAINGWRYSAS